MVVGTLVLLLLGIQVVRALYLDDLEKVLLVPQVATVLFDDRDHAAAGVGALDRRCSSSSSPSRRGSPGPSSAAVAVRSVPRSAVRDDARPTGALGAVSRFAAQYTVPLRAAMGGLAVLAVLIGDRPSAGAVLVIAVLAAVALTVIEVFRRWGGRARRRGRARGRRAAAGSTGLAAAAAEEQVGGGQRARPS